MRAITRLMFRLGWFFAFMCAGNLARYVSPVWSWVLIPVAIVGLMLALIGIDAVEHPESLG